jgi:hypothetical protein
VTDEAPPTEAEINMAFAWTLLNTIRLFHAVPFEDVLPGEQRFLEKWRSIPAERRQAALEFQFPVRTEADREEEERQKRAARIREALFGREGAR